MTDIGTPSEEMLALEKYISEKYEQTKSTGECWITYQEIKEEFSLDLKTPFGRGKFYSACRRLGVEYICKPKYGYKLSSVNIASNIVDNKVERIKGATKRTETAIDNIIDKHDNELPKPMKESFEYTKHGCAAILGQQRSLKKAIRKAAPQLSLISPLI
jgi:hypothetical protein